MEENTFQCIVCVNNIQRVCTNCNNTCKKYEGGHWCSNNQLQFQFEFNDKEFDDLVNEHSTKFQFNTSHFENKRECSYYCEKCIKLLIIQDKMIHLLKKCMKCNNYSFQMDGPFIEYIGGFIANNCVNFCDRSFYQRQGKVELKEPLDYSENNFICDDCAINYVIEKTEKCSDCPYEYKRSLKYHDCNLMGVSASNIIFKPDSLAAPCSTSEMGLLGRAQTNYCDKCIRKMIISETVEHSVKKCINCEQYAFDVCYEHIMYDGGFVFEGQMHFGYGSCHDTYIYDLLDKNQYAKGSFVCDKCVDDFIEKKIVFKRHICHTCKSEELPEEWPCIDFLLDSRQADLSVVKKINNELYLVDPGRYSMEIDSNFKSNDSPYLRLKDDSVREGTEICDNCIRIMIKDNKVVHEKCENCNEVLPYCLNRYMSTYRTVTGSTEHSTQKQICSRYESWNGINRYAVILFCDDCNKRNKSQCEHNKTTNKYDHNKITNECDQCIKISLDCLNCKKYVDKHNSKDEKTIILCDVCAQFTFTYCD